MTPRVLTLRDLNRATLARQLLLERSTMSIPAAVEALVGLQSQSAIAPYIGLWTRLADFKRDALAALIDSHTIIKATLMRSTLHLFTAADYLHLRATLQPVFELASSSITQSRGVTFDLPAVLEMARVFLDEAPRSFAEITAMFEERMPGTDVGSLRYSVRNHLPLVQVPTSTTWSYPGNPKFTRAETWLGQEVSTEDQLETLIMRYLAAFGPAGVTDFQTWSGLPKMKPVFETLKPKLVVYKDEGKRELFDLPDAPMPDGDTPAPERLLPEYDNLLLSHQNRTRIVADAYRKQVYLPALRVASTFLVDGFVRGAWKIEEKKKLATLTFTPFAPITAANRAALTEEGEKLVRFASPDAKDFAVAFAD